MKSFFVICVVLVAALAVEAQTECQRQREKELAANTEIKMIPKCDENGDFEALQCFEGSKFCMCWTPSGHHVEGPSIHIKTCDCISHRERQLEYTRKGMIGTFVPQCKEDGTYAPLQCHGSTGLCWCADEKGNRLSEPQRNPAQNC
uniref:U23-Hexatoxin-Hc1a_1 n=1 Tax=Hadronyche cerberea TaxID=1107879 RepID=A0A4Q8K8D1_HADCE